MSINTIEILEYRIRKLKREMSAILRKLDKIEEEIKGFRKETNERFDGVDKRFDGCESRFDGLENKLEKSFIVVANGFKATGHDSYTNELKEIWKDDS